jgi:DNA polymerase III epsilon subunit-like protein
MIHLNGNIICAIDTETTGLDPLVHEILEICILPLNSDLKPLDGIMPFNIFIRPENTNTIDAAALKVSGYSIEQVMQMGIDPLKAIDYFEEWFEKLKLPLNKKIVPLGHNYAFDKAFIQKWMGNVAYNHYFDYHCRDTASVALYLNDWADFHNEKPPFPKYKLSYLCSQLKVENTRAHTALSDCMATAECFRKMCVQGPHIPV